MNVLGVMIVLLMVGSAPSAWVAADLLAEAGVPAPPPPPPPKAHKPQRVEKSAPAPEARKAAEKASGATFAAKQADQSQGSAGDSPGALPPPPPPPPPAKGKMPVVPPAPTSQGEPPRQEQREAKAEDESPPAPPPPAAGKMLLPPAPVPGGAKGPSPPAAGEAKAAPPPPPPASGAKTTPPPPPPPGVPTPPPATKGEKPAAQQPSVAPPARGAEAPVKAAALPPFKGSQVPVEQNQCLTCHGDSDLWDAANRRLYIPKDKLAEDVHFARGVNCHDCHGGNYQEPDLRMAHAVEDGFRQPLSEVRKACVHCHKQQYAQLNESVHGKAGEQRDELGRGTPLECSKCHGPVSHYLIASRDARSPLFPDNQVHTCDNCHRQRLETYKNDLDTYRSGVHGHGLYKSGLQVTAVCADCHGSHGIYYASNSKSTLHPTRVAETCGKCHRFIEERLQKSVHARGNGAGAPADRQAPGGKGRRKPSCTDCHQGHDQVHPESAAFRQELPHRCGNCHANLSTSYAMSLHGQLTELGYGPAAKCSDCHGAHEILAVADPNSTLSPANRAQTCGQCHVVNKGNFLKFDPHLDHTDPQRSRLVHGVYLFFMTFLVTVFAVFGVHTLLWFIRSLIDVWQHGRARGLRPGEPAYVRFVPFHRISHWCLLISFLGLALTGLPLKYSDTQWAKSLAYALGGFQSTSVWHRIFAVVTFGCFFVYVGRMIRHVVRHRHSGSVWEAIFGPDSPVANWRDVKDLVRMLRWFFGLGPRPRFERWTYWEKFDFWGACADVVIIGFTGLVLWFPQLFTAFLPAVTLNIAKVIHSTQALLATGFVFAVHFFNTHFRPNKFPADLSALTGLVSEEELRHERPDYYERLRANGELEARRALAPSRGKLWMIRLLGFAALGIGLALLIGMIVAGLEK